MSMNILIGVGGTGAKIIEAVLHTSAAGLGPDGMTVGFVDQDQGNGNVARTLGLLNTLVEARRLWRGESSPHRLGADCGLLRTELRSLSPGHEVWVPNRDQNTNLAMILGEATMASEDRHLFDLLFAAGDTEQTMPLDEGYRGRPNIGAAAMAAKVDEDVEFWRALVQRIGQAQGGEDVRLMLAGSVFGGTGAAGFPTLARLIRRRLNQQGVRRNIRIGGVLMLPYFGFERPKSDEGVEGNVARREQLLQQSQSALKYYHALFQSEAVFNELYLVGWNRLFELGYHSPGAAEQSNPPLAPELLAALAIDGFFNKDVPQDVHNRVFVSARADDAKLTWSDLPSPIPGHPNAPFEGLGRLLRFSTAWLYWRGQLVERNAIEKLVKTYPWYRLQLSQVDFRRAPPEAEITKLDEYVRAFLWWAACLEHYSGSAGTSFELWRTSPMIGSIDRDNPTGTYGIRTSLDEPSFGPAYDAVVVNKSAADPLPRARALLEHLNNRRASDDNRGLGVFVASLEAFTRTEAH